MTPDEVVVAYNDSRGRNANPINILRRCRSPTMAAPPSPVSPKPAVKVHLPIPLAIRLFCTTSRPAPGLLSGWMGNGGCTLGGYKSTTPADPNSWTHFCVHPNGGDDRESGWADNNPASPFFGNMYISWNDFNMVNAGIFVFALH